MGPWDHISTWWGIITEIEDGQIQISLLLLLLSLLLLAFLLPYLLGSLFHRFQSVGYRLKPGDHICTWRGTGTEIHDGIYVDDQTVIYFECGYQRELHGVVSYTVEQFCSDGGLYVFEYDVNPVIFLAKPEGNFCTTASADPTESVLHRARFLLDNSSADYHLYIKNCYDFAIYCKTGLIMYNGMEVVRNVPVVYALAVTTSVFFYILLDMAASFTDLAATCLGIYSTCRLALDIGDHPHLIKVEVERFAQVERLASHSFGFPRTVRFLLKLVLLALICASTSLAFSRLSETRPLVWGLAGIKFLYWPLLNRTFEFRWVFSNKLRNKDQLQPGDHIYTWRNWYSYAHHGIYVGEEKVIHLTRGGGPIIPIVYPRYNPINGDGPGGVEVCSINTFLSGGNIYLYDYGVDLAFFIAKSRGGTCTVAHSDPPGLVLHRASFLVERSFGAYNLFYNNCEDFALYCKTGLLVPRTIALGRSGQIISIIAVICALISFPYSSLLTSSGGYAGGIAVGYVLYSIWRLFSDTGFRPDARRVGVRELDAFDRFIAFMSQQLFLSLVPKFICFHVLIRTYLYPEESWAIRSKNCLVDWITTVAYMWFALF